MAGRIAIPGRRKRSPQGTNPRPASDHARRPRGQHGHVPPRGGAVESRLRAADPAGEAAKIHTTLEQPTAPGAPTRGSRRRDLTALALLAPAPSLGAWLALWVAPGPLGQAVYLGAKLWILILPLVWLRWVERAPPSLSPLPRAHWRPALREALLVGAGLAAGLWLVWWTLGDILLDPGPLREIARASGFASTPGVYLAFALQLALVNALLEEYVWRWFVLRRCEGLALSLAVPLAALLFTLHHAIAFTRQLGPGTGLLASLAVFGAGVLWGWQYRRWRSIWPGYVSHVLVDLAALAIGWRILFP